MQIIRAADFGIVPNTEIAENLIKLFAHAKATDGEKTVLFDAGTYSIDSAKCEQKMLYITNTVGDEEFEDGEVPHKNAVPFYLEGISDLTVDGGGAGEGGGPQAGRRAGTVQAQRVRPVAGHGHHADLVSLQAIIIEFPHTHSFFRV